MNEIASKGQLWMALARRALFTVPIMVFLGFLSGRMAGSGWSNRWFQMLDKPAIVPPGWVFGTVWTILYIMMGLSLALALSARGARLRWPAVALFIVQFILNLIWSPLFFAQHQVTLALYLILVIALLVAITILLLWRVRVAAAVLLLPYLAWLGFASWLNFQIDQRNPYAETLVVPTWGTQI